MSRDVFMFASMPLAERPVSLTLKLCNSPQYSLPDLGHDASSWLQPCHWLLFPLISSVAGLRTLCTAICTELMESSSRILLQTLVA